MSSFSVGAAEDLTDGTDDKVGLAFVPVLKSPRKIDLDILYIILIV